MLIQGKGKVSVAWSQVPVRVPLAHDSVRVFSLNGPEPTGRQPEETGVQSEQHHPGWPGPAEAQMLIRCRGASEAARCGEQ